MSTSNLSLTAEPLTREAFRLFGDVIETNEAERFFINNGTTTRFHDLAKVEATGTNARVLINIFRGDEFHLPQNISMLERHPFGSQAFIPLQPNPYLVVVGEDHNGVPTALKAFLAQGNQGVNYHRNVWHHPLVSLGGISDFAVIDRGGEENNLEECFFDQPFIVSA